MTVSGGVWGPRSRGTRDDRGQLILVGAIAIAIVFVALALVFNTAIYTSTLATQESSADGFEPVAYQDATADGVGGVIYYANYYNYSSGYDALVGTTRNGTVAWSKNTTRHTLASRTATVSRVVDTTNGTQILQDQNATFENATGADDWALATDVNGMRRFSVHVVRGSLESRGTTDEVLGTLDGVDDPFHVRVTNGSATRYVFLYNNSDDVVVQVETESGGVVGRCRDDPGDPAVVDITQGRVDGEDCPALTFPGMEGPYAITYNASTEIDGRYSLVVDRTESNVPDSYNDVASGDPPYAARALYSASVEMTYESADVRYTTTVDVTPATPPQGPSYTLQRPELVRRLVYVEDGAGLRSVARGGVPTSYPAGSASNLYGLGMYKYGLDDDDETEIAYVNSSTKDALKIIDETGETQQLAPDVFKDGIAVATWPDNGLSEPWVFYSNRNDNKNIYRARYQGGSKVDARVKDTPASSIVGVANFEPDAGEELVYLGTSATVHYLDADGTVVETGYSVGSTKSAPGRPADFDGDGVARMPFIDGSGYVALVDHDKDKTAYASNASKTAVTSADVDDDARPEIVYVDTDDRLSYVDFTSDSLTWEAHPLMADVDDDGTLERIKVRRASGVA